MKTTSVSNTDEQFEFLNAGTHNTFSLSHNNSGSEIYCVVLSQSNIPSKMTVYSLRYLRNKCFESQFSILSSSSIEF